MMELLVPVGDKASFFAALNASCDAVYLAGKSFGARSFAPNFEEEELLEVIQLGKIYGVKVYITMNTLIKDDEVDTFLEQVELLYRHGVDAIIMQDFGMIALCLKKYPNLEIHASTQCNSSSLETIELLYQLGVKRVVLPREMSLAEINEITVPIEKEIFIHGALCVSYSGCCLYSQMLGGRSGNRGQCAGSCRLPYTLYEGSNKKKEGYLLSMKELHMKDLIHSLPKDIVSLKIEGRMKGASYVSFITQYYRKIMNGLSISINEEDQLKSLFYRGFTKGHLFGEKDLINSTSPNHQGLPIGEVIYLRDDKIIMKLKKELNQGDGIRFLHSKKGMMVNFLYDEKEKLIAKGEKNQIVMVDNKIDLQQVDIVTKTTNVTLEKEVITDRIIRKVPITITCIAKKNQPLQLEFNDFNNHKVTYEGPLVCEASKQPLSKERISEQLKKLGNSPFVCETIEIEMDADIFLRIGDLNIARRILTERLIGSRINDFKEAVVKDFSLSFQPVKKDFSLKEYHQIPRNPFHLKPHLTGKVAVSNLLDARNYDCIGTSALNVYNSYTVYFLEQLGFKAVTLSTELSEEELQSLIKKVRATVSLIPLLVRTKGLVEVMIIKGNILEIEEHKTYQLVNRKEQVFPVSFDGVLTHIYSHEPLFLQEHKFTLENVFCIGEE